MFSPAIAKRFLSALLLTALSSTSPSRLWPVAAANQESEVTRLADGIYVRLAGTDSNAVANAAFVELESAVLVFDTHFTPEAGRALLSEIAKVTSKPVRYVVNSHFHPDHTHGNQAFSAAPHFVGSTNTRRDILQKDLPAMSRTLGIAQAQLEKLRKDLLQQRDPEQQTSLRNQIRQRQEFLDRMSKLKIISPAIAIEDSLVFQDGERKVELLHLGLGHTDGDIVLFLPAERIVFAGDLFFNSALPNTQDAFLLPWITTLGELLKLQADTFVPGHGPVGTREQVRAFRSYLEDLKALVESRISRGESMEQVLAEVKIPAKYAALAFQNFFPANIQKMYIELKALAPPPGAPSNPEAVRKLQRD